MATGPVALIALLLAWALYFAVHSLLAGTRMKAWVEMRLPALHRRYRLVYNVLALLALVPPLWLQWQLAGPPLFHLPGPVRLALDALALLAVAAFLWTLRWYDMRTFMGLRDPQTDAFTLSPLHRHVRHPWYFLALIVIWTRPIDAAWLATSLAITAYLVIGSRLEDHKLIEAFGEPYRRYRARVPGLFPLPGRRLTKEEAMHWTARVDTASRVSEAARTGSAR